MRRRVVLQNWQFWTPNGRLAWAPSNPGLAGKDAKTGISIGPIKVVSCTMGWKLRAEPFGWFTSAQGEHVFQCLEFTGEDGTEYVCPVSDADLSVSKLF